MWGFAGAGRAVGVGEKNCHPSNYHEKQEQHVKDGRGSLQENGAEESCEQNSSTSNKHVFQVD